MGKYFEKYILHPIEKEITDADAKVDLVRSADNPIMDFFYESAFYRHEYVICDDIYALPYEEIFCFASTNGDPEKLGATVKMEINGQLFETDKNTMLVVPALVPHGKIEVTNVEVPIFSYVAGRGREHVGLPKENWKTEDVPPIEQMATYNNGPINDPPLPPEANQKTLVKALSRYIPGIEMFTVLRRFEESGPWFFSKGHIHDGVEVLCYYGSDPWHPYEFDGEVTQWIGGEKFTINKPSVCFFAPYVYHCPLQIEKINKPCIWHSLSPVLGSYSSSTIEGLTSEDGNDIEVVKPW